MTYVEVKSVCNDRIRAQIPLGPKQYSKSPSNLWVPDDPNLGGVSGGPAFVLNQQRWELVGTIKEQQEDLGIFVLSSLAGLNGKGDIGQTGFY